MRLISSMRCLAFVGLCGTVGVLACGEDPVGDDLRFPVLLKVSGDSQQIAPLAGAVPLVVQLVDNEGDTLPGLEVTFSMLLGTGTLVTTDTTDADGFASTTFTATAAAGARKIRAQVPGDEQVFDLLVGPGVGVVPVHPEVAGEALRYIGAAAQQRHRIHRRPVEQDRVGQPDGKRPDDLAAGLGPRGPLDPRHPARIGH